MIEKMGFSGYFLIVADFIQWAKDNGIPVGPGPRLGRGLAGRLVAQDHRPRSAALRPAVRALPQSRARVDAGLRHRLLPGQARRGDRLRARRIRPRPRRRRSSPSASCRPAPCCATSAACCGMPYGQVDRICKLVPNNPAKPVTPGQGAGDRAAPEGAVRGRRGDQAADRPRAAARRPLPQRLDPCRRRGDRRPAARPSWCRSTAIRRSERCRPPSST